MLASGKAVPRYLRAMFWKTDPETERAKMIPRTCAVHQVMVNKLFSYRGIEKRTDGHDGDCIVDFGRRGECRHHGNPSTLEAADPKPDENSIPIEAGVGNLCIDRG